MYSEQRPGQIGRCFPMNRNVEFEEFQRPWALTSHRNAPAIFDIPGSCVICAEMRLQSRFSSRSAGTFLTSLWQQCIRTSMPPRLQFQLNVRTIHPDFVGAQSLRRRRAEHLAGADPELGAMPGASDLVAL